MKRKYLYTFAVLCILCTGFSLWVLGSKYEKAHFPIRHVVFEGEYWQVPQSDLEAIVSPYTKSGYFLINLFSLRSHLLEKEPWIQAVSISRRWPESIVLTLNQRTAFAALNDHFLVTSTGEIFSPPPNSFPPDLLILNGPQAQVKKMLENYHFFTSAAVSANLSIMRIDLSPEGNWSVALNNKIVVMLGEDDILARFKRFIKVYEQVFVPQHREPSYVDMRYSHGMAVNWKS